MIKQLILLFHVFGVFFYQLIFSGDITVQQHLPSSIQAGNEVTVEITVHKSDVTGFAKVQQIIPQGFDVEPIETKGATFSFKDNKIKFIWMSLPVDEEFTISYKLKADATLTGDFTFGGKFSFISDSERKNIEMEKATISVIKESVNDAVTANTEGENNSTSIVPVPAAVAIPVAAAEVTPPTTIKVVTVKCVRTITEVEPGKLKVNIKINKDGVKGFARIVEEIPNGFIASEDNSNGGVFSFKNQHVKILWMAVPKDDEYEITYLLTADNNTTNGNYDIKGEFSYLENDATRNYTIDGSSFDLKQPEAEPIAIAAEEEENSVIVEPIENKITSTPSPENGVTYKIQVGAGHKTVSSKYFAKKFNLQNKVSIMNHEGWIKYLVGNYSKYKEARDQRETVRKKVKAAFVTAYNSGKRITVQEAIMISNQKWYK